MPKKKTSDITETVLIDGAEYEVVTPQNFSDLMRAIKIRDLIQDAISAPSNECHNANLQEGLEMQQSLIQKYMDENIGEFDNRYLISNIAFLAKKNGLRIGELEKLLGLSAGYISRTAKESSAKKLSIDVVWKIGKLFEEDLQSLLCTNLRIPNKNTDVLALFLAKLYCQTEHNEIHWENHGGAAYELENEYRQLKFLTENDDGSVQYHPESIWNNRIYEVRSDLHSFWVTDDKELLMIEVGLPDRDETLFYDFVFVWSEKEKNQRKLKWDFAFSTRDDITSTLNEYAKDLMSAVISQELDSYLPDDAKDIILDYLK